MKRIHNVMIPTIVFLLGITSVVVSQQITLQEAETLSQSPVCQEMGFPFNSAKYLLKNNDLYSIAKSINSWRETGLLESKNINEILHNHKGKNKKNGLAIKNASVLEEEGIDVHVLMPALCCASQLVAVDDIQVLLGYATVFIGAQEDAFDVPLIGMGAPIGNRETLSPEARLVFWPAANAIISRSTETVPLLIKSLQDETLDTLLRLRAASFLVEMAPDTLNDDLIHRLQDKDFKEKVACIRKGNIGWKKLTPSPCHQKEREEKIIQKWEQINRMKRDSMTNR